MEQKEETISCVPISPRDLPRYELEEQLRFYKTELENRDELIRDLTKVTASVPAVGNQRTVNENGGSDDKLDEIRSRVEKLQLTIAQNRDMIYEKNTVICELRAENEAIRVDCLTHTQRIEELEQLLEEKAGHLSSYKTAEEQHDLIVRSLQQDVKTKNDKLLNLQSELRISEQRFNGTIAQFKQKTDCLTKAVTDFASLLDCEPVSDKCLLKLAELLRANSLYKTQLTQKSDQIESFEFEQRASRETVLRLSGEMKREQTEKEAAKSELQTLQNEVQKLRAVNEKSEAHVTLLEDRVKQLTGALSAARKEAEETMRKFTLLAETEAKIQPKISVNETSSRKSSIHGDADKEDSMTVDKFIGKISNWLQILPGTRTSEVLSMVLDRIEQMDERMEMCSANMHANEEELTLLRRNENEYNVSKRHLLERIEDLERQRASDGTLIDSLRVERNQFHDLICKLALAVKFEDAVNEPSLAILGETLLARITQLQNGDTEKQAKQRLQITRLQRDLRESKEHGDSLELQLSIMRRRLAETQEQRNSAFTPASQTPTTLAASEKERRRLAKQLQQTREDADKLREEIVLLKARLLDTSREKLVHVGQSKNLRAAEARMNDLRRTCEEQKEDARKARVELEHIRKCYTADTQKLEESCSKLELELRGARDALEASRRSEEQLLDFRSMVARHLGLDNEHLSVPDYEILVHLDRLVAANQAHIANVVATERALNLVQGNIR